MPTLIPGAPQLGIPQGPQMTSPQMSSPQMGIPGSAMFDYMGNADNPPDIYGQLGVSNGKNPIRPLTKRAGVGLGARALSQVAFGNELEPQRQASIRRAIALTDPGNSGALIDQYGRRAVADALEFARIQSQALGGAGMGSGGQQGATQATFNQAQGATNQFAGQIMSSQGQLAALKDQLAAFGLGQDPELVALLSQLSAELEGVNATRFGQKEANPLMGGLGSLAGAALSNPKVFG